MRQLIRWYDIDVLRYEGPDPTEELDGGISRFKNIARVLSALEATSPLRTTACALKATPDKIMDGSGVVNDLAVFLFHRPG